MNMKERANKTYHVVVTAIDGDTGIETEEVNDTFNNGFITSVYSYIIFSKK